MELSLESLRPQIAEALDLEPNYLKASTTLNGNEYWDSFAMLSIVALITQKTGKQVTLDNISTLHTVTDLITLCQDLKDN